MFLIVDADSNPALMLTSPGNIFCWRIWKASASAGPMIEEKADLSSISTHYIGYIPLELYQTALQPDPSNGPNHVAGRVLIDQTQAQKTS